MIYHNLRRWKHSTWNLPKHWHSLYLPVCLFVFDDTGLCYMICNQSIKLITYWNLLSQLCDVAPDTTGLWRARRYRAQRRTVEKVSSSMWFIMSGCQPRHFVFPRILSFFLSSLRPDLSGVFLRPYYFENHQTCHGDWPTSEIRHLTWNHHDV